MAAMSSIESTPVTSKHMDPSLFHVIMKDDKHELRIRGGRLKHQITPNGNTALHVAAQYDKADCVDAILELCPSLLLRHNDLEETALHPAARRGNLKIVKALVESAENNYDIEREGRAANKLLLIRKISKNEDTALHEAAKYNRINVVKFLMEKDPDFRYSPNKHGETPLYSAARKGFSEVALEILEKSTSPSYEGPLGRTALHAAVASNLKELCDQILEKMLGLAEVGDEKKRTPLHFAAWFNRHEVVETLIRFDAGCAYMRDDEGMAPLHIAAKEGHTSFIAKLLEACPDCYEMVDTKGRNALHIAAESGKESTVEALLKHPQFSSLINEGDDKGDTPLHLLAKSQKYIRSFLKHKDLDMAAVNYEHSTALDILPPKSFSSPDAVDLLRSKLEKVTLRGVVANNSKVDVEVVNDKNRPHADKGKDDVGILDRMSETHMLVATLIATITFAAGFTLPGGYNDDQGPDVGTATLVRKSAFQAFVFSDTIALLLSLCAVFTHFLSVMKNDYMFRTNASLLAFSLTVIAMAAMVMAYVTGTFAVLTPSLGLAIVNSAIGCLFFVYVFVLIMVAFRN